MPQSDHPLLIQDPVALVGVLTRKLLLDQQVPVPTALVDKCDEFSKLTPFRIASSHLSSLIPAPIAASHTLSAFYSDFVEERLDPVMAQDPILTRKYAYIVEMRGTLCVTERPSTPGSSVLVLTVPLVCLMLLSFL